MIKKYSKKLIILFSIIILISLIFSGPGFNLLSFAAEDNNTVKVGYYSSEGFNDGAKEGSIKSGYGYDYLQRIAQYTGWTYEYYYGDWSELYDMFINGDIDLMAGISYTEERADIILYPDYVMGYENYYIYKHADDNTISGSDLSTLNGKRAGGPKNNLMTNCLESWTLAQGLNLDIVYYEGFEDRDQAFYNNEIDIITGTDNNVSSESGMVPVTKIGDSAYYLCVTQSRADLLEELNSALAELNNAEPYYLQNLQYKYFNDTAVTANLEGDELIWVNENSLLTVGYLNDFLPYSQSDKNGNPYGLVNQVIPDILKVLSLENTIEVNYKGYDTYDEMLEALNNGEVDCVFPMSGNHYFSEIGNAQLSSPVLTSGMVLAYTDEFTSKTTEKIAVNTSIKFLDYYTIMYYPDATYIYCSSSEECLQAVLEGRAGSTVIESVRANSLLNNSKYDNILITQLPDNDDRCIGVKAGNLGLVKLLNRGLTILGENYGIINSAQYIDELYEYSVEDFISQNWLLLVAILIIVIAIIMLNVYMQMKEQQKHSRELAVLLKEAEAANIAKTTFLNNMSHDIRTPMNAIIGYTNLIKENNGDDKLKDYLDKISFNSEHLLSLINDVLDISRIESGHVKLNPAPISLKAISDQVIAVVNGSLSNRKLDLVLDRKEEKNTVVLADSLKIREILINILSNAIKFTADEGTIYYKVCEKENDGKTIKIRYTIKDTGTGISEDFIKHIFEDFAQENNGARTNYKGTGLGLSITKKYVDMLGGDISVVSNKGQGTEFNVDLTFPVVNEIPDGEDFDSAGTESISGLNILLVEDNEFNAEIARDILESFGASVELAENGKIALDRYKEVRAQAFDIILMDIQMPEMDGYEATRQIRVYESVNAMVNVPIVAMTANCFAEDVQKAFDAGMDGHVSKPINTEELIKTIVRVCNQMKVCKKG